MVLQPPLPLQLFLPLQPLSLLLQPPWPLQSFLPLQECLACLAWGAVVNDALPAFRMGVTPVVPVVDACMTVAPLSRPETAAATIMVFIDCFICHSSCFEVQTGRIDFVGPGTPGGRPRGANQTT